MAEMQALEWKKSRVKLNRKFNRRSAFLLVRARGERLLKSLEELSCLYLLNQNYVALLNRYVMNIS